MKIVEAGFTSNGGSWSEEPQAGLSSSARHDERKSVVVVVVAVAAVVVVSLAWRGAAAVQVVRKRSIY